VSYIFEGQEMDRECGYNIKAQTGQGTYIEYQKYGSFSGTLKLFPASGTMQGIICKG
jgi:hypothetical protein